MKVQEIFDLAIKKGVEADPRGAKGVKKYFDRIKKQYDGAKGKEKEYFDQDKLTNPYLDSFVLVDDKKTQVKRVLAGIDVNAGEILLANQLTQNGKKIDLVIAHHPEGKALAYLHEVMEMNTDIFISHGVPVHIAEKLMDERIRELERGLHRFNHYQSVRIAELLNVNFINTHTITDNMVDAYVTDFLAKKNPETIGDIMEALMEIPEYQIAQKMGFGPKIISGSPKNRVGKIILEMTGGTNPSNKIYQEFSQYGVSTLVSMHMRDEAVKNAGDSHMNIVVAGHMSSDSLGMNLWLDELEKRGIEIVPCGGLIRVSRVKKGKK